MRRDFDLYPIEIPRPADGWTTAPIECGTCGLSLSCTVYSRAEMRRAGRRISSRGLAMIVGGAAYFTVLGFLLGAVTPGDVLLAFVVILSMAAFILMFIGVMLAIVVPRWVTGVTLQRDRDHELRRPGATLDIEYRHVGGQ